MAIKAAINGFGRIGRLVLRSIIESGRKDIEIIAINDLASPNDNAHLLKYDSIHGTFPKNIKVGKSSLRIEKNPAITISAERDPAKLNWDKNKIDIVFECTGLFTTREQAAKHIKAGAKRVLISAPANGADQTIVYGVNHTKLRKNHLIVSNASCTTNCLAPVAQVLNKTCGIRRGYMTTIHAFTGDQRVVDTHHSDLRRARAASIAMIPTSTGAAKAVGLVLPELKGKLDGTAVRVPTPNVSMIDLVFEAKQNTTIEEINNAMIQAAKKNLKGILDINQKPLVSIDFNHNPHSSIFDTTQTQIIDKRLVRVLSWYDNEWGFANRMSDVAVAMIRHA